MEMPKFTLVGYLNTEPGFVAQESMDDTGEGYSRELFMEQVNNMSEWEFHQFCNNMRRNQEFRDRILVPVQRTNGRKSLRN